MSSDAWFCDATVMVEHEHPSGAYTRSWFRCQLPPDHIRTGLSVQHRVRMIDATIAWSEDLIPLGAKT